jgi:hypothetical protein
MEGKELVKRVKALYSRLPGSNARNYFRAWNNPIFIFQIIFCSLQPMKPVLTEIHA